VIVAASLFDHYNKSQLFNFKESKDSAAAKPVDSGQYFYYNPVKSSDLIRVSKEAGRNFFLKTQAKFLQQHHNARAFYHAKSEKVKSRPSDFLSINLALIKQIHYTNPDDKPPLS
jgi:hypothetical protein